MLTSEFEFELPPELIAQKPSAHRDGSRLLVMDRSSGALRHRTFRELSEFFHAGDVLVLNNSRVIPARLRGTNARSGGRFEMLLLEENAVNDWWAMMRPGKRAQVGTEIILCDSKGCATAARAIVHETNPEGHRRLQFFGTQNISAELESLGEIPLPPYINRENHESEMEDRKRYQTVFAQAAGSVAAPTAGLHFTEDVLNELRARGVQVCFVTLHVGFGTFAPVKGEQLSDHVMHEERFEITSETVRVVNEAKRENRRVIAVGTTSVRVLESAAAEDRKEVFPGAARTKIFIFPPRDFKIVDALLTNFHLPCSTLLMLVSAFAAPNEVRGRELILAAYAEAIRERYRFFSYGDAMLIV